MFQQWNSMHDGPEVQTSWSLLEREWRPVWEEDGLGEGRGKPAEPSELQRERGWEFGLLVQGEQLKGLSRGGVIGCASGARSGWQPCRGWAVPGLCRPKDLGMRKYSPELQGQGKTNINQPPQSSMTEGPVSTNSVRETRRAS